MTTKCANCSAEMKSEPSKDFILSQHVCPNCLKDMNTLRLVITRPSPDADWAVEQVQYLRISFQVP